MAVSKKVETLIEMLTPAVTACGFELWGIEFFQQGRHSVLRVYIDGDAPRAVAEGEEAEASAGRGVSVEDCSAVSHQVSGVLDVEDPIAGEYTLEVSSPGWDRPLFTLPQYARFIGAVAAIRLTAPLNGRRKFTGPIQGVTTTDVLVLVDEVAVSIPFLSIDKANIVPTD
jgi:ribosome maturation factor RimP